MMNHTLLTSMCIDNQSNYGASIGFNKDSVSGTTYQPTASSQDLGECNNTIKSTAFYPTLGYGNSDFNQNKGRLERMKVSSYDPLVTGESIRNLALFGKAYALRDNLALGKVISYYGVTHLPLNILADSFAKFPLCKGMFSKITLNLNFNCSFTMTVDANGRFSSVVSSSQNGQVYFMISPIAEGNGLNIASATV